VVGIQLSKIKMVFERYVESFCIEGELPSPLELKTKHCRRVAQEARALSVELGWSISKQNTAEALGLLHDVGRFSQYKEFGTFSDSVSVDHGERGVIVTEKSGWLSQCQSVDRDSILCGIRYHNRRMIPDDLSDVHRSFLCLVRDADKLDIFEIVLNALERDGFRELPSMLPGIDLQGSLSVSLIDEIRMQRRVSIGNVRSLADFLLMQLSWVYTLNYTPAIRRFNERNILSRSVHYLNDDTHINAVVEDINRFLSDSGIGILSRRTVPS